MHVAAGMCQISNAAGRFWRIAGDGRLEANADEPSLFTMELHRNSMLTLRSVLRPLLLVVVGRGVCGGGHRRLVKFDWDCIGARHRCTLVLQMIRS